MHCDRCGARRYTYYGLCLDCVWVVDVGAS
jgi:hypothetical protein